MDVAEAFFEPHHRLAIDGEAEVARLDDAGVHRPDRDLEDTFAFDPAERKGLPLVVKVRACDDIAAERVIARGPELVEREPAEVGMAVRHDAEQVVHLALEEARRERLHGE